jgi:hypothetical protein
VVSISWARRAETIRTAEIIMGLTNRSAHGIMGDKIGCSGGFMDPVSLIVAALAAGAVAGMQGTASEAVKDAYSGLKALVSRRLSGRVAGEMALAQHESKPDQWGPALEAELVEANAAADTAALEAAQRLMALVDTAGQAAGKYVVDLRSAQGVQVGDHNVQTNTFGTSA